MQQTMKRAQQGFTLIELMIVVAIIGILAAIAIPSYQDYTAKSKFTAAQAEIAAGKTAIDAYLNENGAATAITGTSALAIAGLKSPSSNCTLDVSISDATTTLECEIVGGPGSVATETITLTRSGASNGEWACTSSVTNTKLKSKSCGG